MAGPLHTVIKVVACVVLAFSPGQAALLLGKDPNCQTMGEAISTGGPVPNGCGTLVGGEYPVKAVLMDVNDDSGLSTAVVSLFETAKCKGTPAVKLSSSGAQCGITDTPFKSFSINYPSGNPG